MKPLPLLRISVRNSAKHSVKMRLYAAEHFGGPAGLFRMKLGRAWVRSAAEKYRFFSLGAALEYAAASGGLSVQDPPRPALSGNSRVRVAVASRGGVVREKCFASSPPFQGRDGRWRIFVLTSLGVAEYLCDEVEAV